MRQDNVELGVYGLERFLAKSHRQVGESGRQDFIVLGALALLRQRSSSQSPLQRDFSWNGIMTNSLKPLNGLNLERFSFSQMIPFGHKAP